MKLAFRMRDEGLGRTVQEAQKHPVTHSEGDVPMMLIIVSLGILLRLKKAFSDLHQKSVTVPKHSVCRLCLGRPVLEGQEWRWRVAIDHLKRRSSERRVERCVVAILHLGKPVDLGARAIPAAHRRYITMIRLTTSDWPSVCG